MILKLIDYVRGKLMKKVFGLILFALMTTSLVACSTPFNSSNSSIEIPDLRNTNENTAETIISNLSLIPVIEYEYNDFVLEGKVIRTSPGEGREVDELSNITLYISLGPSVIYASDATMQWYSVENSSGDDFTFRTPRIEDGELLIDMTVTFNSTSSMKWNDRYNNGNSFGSASLSELFDKTVPIQIEYENLNIIAGESQDITVRVPLSNLSESRPTNLFTKLNVELGSNRNYDVLVNFTMSW